MPDGCDCEGGDTIRDEDWTEDIRERSEGPLFAPESLVVMSWILGSTQCSNIRMFIVEEVVD